MFYSDEARTGGRDPAAGRYRGRATMNDSEKEVYLLRAGFYPDSERGRAAWAWLSGETYSPSSMGRELGIQRSNASTARTELERLGLLFAREVDQTNGREHLFTLVEAPAGMSNADMARRIQSVEYDASTVSVDLGDGSRYEIVFDGDTEPAVKRKRASK